MVYIDLLYAVHKSTTRDYGIKPGDKSLDIGCGKDFQLYELTQLVSGLEVYGFDISSYALENAKPEILDLLNVGNANNLLQHFGKGLSSSLGGEAEPASDISRYLRLLAAGRIQLVSLVTEIFAQDEINMAIEHMCSGAIVGRCLVDMEPEYGQ